MTVSWIVPAHNPSPIWLAQCLASIQSQTYTDFECLLIDDGSAVPLQIPTDTRFRILRTDHAGISNALNLGISQAQGKWIARLDADDIACPIRLENQIRYAEANKLHLCGADIQTIFAAGVPETYLQAPAFDDSVEQLRNGLICCWHPTWLAKTFLLQQCPYPAEYESCEDFALQCLLAMSGARIGNWPALGTYYRMHADQTVRAKKDQCIANRNRAIKELL